MRYAVHKMIIDKQRKVSPSGLSFLVSCGFVMVVSSCGKLINSMPMKGVRKNVAATVLAQSWHTVVFRHAVDWLLIKVQHTSIPSHPIIC